MSVTRIIFTILFSVCIFHLTYAESNVSRREDCSISLNILLAVDSSSFVHTCDCLLGTGRRGPVARAELQFSKSLINSAARSAAAIRCILKGERQLLPLCFRRPRKFERQAKKRLQRCIKAKPNASERRLKGKFKFSTRRCTAVLATFFGARTAGVWLCECFNNGFDVISGRAGFVTDASPLGAAQELETVKICGTKMTGQMQEVCANSPADFSILGLQLLQVCCKRGRVRLPNGKFGCAAIVPDDLAGLKDTS